MIYYSVPFSSEKNIGKYYNQFMEIIPNDDDWGCFIDADTIFTTPDYGLLIERAVAENPKASCFTAYTNRVGCKWQVLQGIDYASDDIKYHREIGNQLKVLYGSTVLDVSRKPMNEVMSGFLFLLKKEAWKEIGGFKEDGMLGIDSDLHWRLMKHHKKFFLIKGLYLYHWYRGANPKDKSHLL